MTFFLQKLLAPWWSRILFFLLLWFVFAVVEHRAGILYQPYISLFAASLLTEHLRRGSRWFALGLYPGKTALRETGWGLLFAASGVAAYLLAALAAGGTYLANENLLTQNLLRVSVTIFIFAAGEEFFFRGILFQALAERFNAIAVTVLFSGFFMLAHSYNPGTDVLAMANIFLANIFLSQLYLLTGSLWGPIAFHFFWNWLQYGVLGLPISGIDFGELIGELRLPGWSLNQQWLFGGLFGMEGSVICTVVLIVSIIIAPRVARISAFVTALRFRRDFAESKLLSQ